MTRDEKKKLQAWAKELYATVIDAGVSTDIHGNIKQLIETFDLDWDDVHNLDEEANKRGK